MKKNGKAIVIHCNTYDEWLNTCIRLSTTKVSPSGGTLHTYGVSTYDWNRGLRYIVVYPNELKVRYAVNDKGFTKNPTLWERTEATDFLKMTNK
jgi:hypothetical protein